MKLEFSQQIFEEVSNIKFNQNPSSGSRIVPCRQTDRHEANTDFSQFCDLAYKPMGGNMTTWFNVAHVSAYSNLCALNGKATISAYPPYTLRN